VRSQRAPLSGPPVVAFAGRLVQEKGIDVLLRAFAVVVEHVREAQLLIVGEGPQRKFLERLASDLNLSACVSMPGHLDSAQMEQLFETVWVQVVPSRWAEPFGNVAPEAMMRGTVVIASNSGGLTEIVQSGETGFLVTPGDTDELADALLKLLQNRELAEQMGRAGREVALAHFSATACAHQFMLLYERMRGNDSTGARLPQHND
jgi:glycosyltransferase involved in cell wall biosynthesis